jgi:hypothetical protein
MAAKKAPAPAPSSPSIPSAAKDRAFLLALSAEYEVTPSEAITALTRRAQLVRATASAHETALIARSQVTAADIAELSVRLSRLERMEEAWLLARTERKSAAVKAAREPLELAKEDALAALEYFCGDDAAVLAAIDLIRPGDSHDDLAADGKKVAVLIEQNEAKLAKADFNGATPKEAAKNLRDGVQALEAALDNRHVKVDAGEAILLRNRAAAHVSELVDRIVAAGRYAFRREPLIASQFPSRDAGRTRKAKKAPTP